ncbi:hypothetical protein [Pseudomonas phage Itty13]|uniref:DUF6874 domain-containing protein n=1 Tax=Pseudomonas phage Itty13 TaxID=2805750 RepID=A0A889IRP4_9CAUD|nr:hypothetical protein PQC19_gp37 [Pseudomonas phage Itty13]QRE00613.1 hypothetical protein [Pseudomonas phage Itty13]
MTREIVFTATDTELETAQLIVERAESMARKYGQEIDRTSLLMDLIACNANGCPLKFQALLDADDGNFAHDVFGIRRYMDRTTGQLTDCFLPRFAV